MERIENRKEKTNRIYYLDILRVVACLAVIVIHSSTQYVIKDFGSFNFWIGNIFDGITRIGVPIFVMISGALMLDKNYKYTNKKIIQHIKKLIIFFIFWSLIYTIIYHIIIKYNCINVREVVLSFVEGNVHLWFIYMIIGLYLIVPLLRLWVKDENKKYIEYFIMLSMIFSFFIPQIINIGSKYNDIFNSINKVVENINIKYVGGFTTYFLLGWYLHNYDLKNKKAVYILGVISMFITIMGTYIFSISTREANQMYGNLTLNVLFQTIMIFSIVKEKYNKNTERNKYIDLISNNSLGIYAIHFVIVSIMSRILIEMNINIAIINIPIIFICTFLISNFVVSLLKKITILEKIV